MNRDFWSHKNMNLFPLFLAAIEIKKNCKGNLETATPYGFLYIKILRRKYSSPNAETHASYVSRLSQLPSFEKIMSTRKGFVEPVFPVIVSDVHNFTDFNLDAN